MGRTAPLLWRRVTVVGALMLAAFAFHTTENLPIRLLRLIAGDLHVSLPSVGYLVTGYGLTVAVVSLPLAHVTRSMPRRHLLTGLLAARVPASWVSTLGASYGLLLGARVVTAVAQALFWAVMGPVAVGLFSPAVRGRVIGALSFGGSLATVAGIPAGTWLGQHQDWQAPFLVISALGVVSLVLVAALLPTSRPEDGHAAYGQSPDRRRFGIVVATTEHADDAGGRAGRGAAGAVRPARCRPSPSRCWRCWGRPSDRCSWRRRAAYSPSPRAARRWRWRPTPPRSTSASPPGRCWAARSPARCTCGARSESAAC